MKLLSTVVRRLTTGLIDQHRPATVTMYPGDVVGFRLFGQRQEFRTTLRSCFHLAVKQHVRAERQRRDWQEKQR